MWLEFDPDVIFSKSQAAAGLCSWVKNIMVFHYINENVRPLRIALVQANAELKAAMDKLNALRNRLAVSLSFGLYVLVLPHFDFACIFIKKRYFKIFFVYACFRSFRRC